jgi:hypothetical protein
LTEYIKEITPTKKVADIDGTNYTFDEYTNGTVFKTSPGDFESICKTNGSTCLSEWIYNNSAH